MAISNYSELKTAIASWLDRTDLTDIIPDFIALAETRHKRDFKIRRMETRVTANTIDGSEFYSLPDDYVAMRNIKLNTDPKTPLEFLTPQNDKRIQVWSGYYDRAKQDIITSNERDRHSGTTPVTRIDYGLY